MISQLKNVEYRMMNKIGYCNC